MSENALVLLHPDGSRALNWAAWERLLPRLGPAALAAAQLVAMRCRSRRGTLAWRVTETELAEELGLGRDALRALLPRLLDEGLVLRPSRGLLEATPALLSDAAGRAVAEEDTLAAVSGDTVAQVFELRPVSGTANVGFPDTGSRPSPARLPRSPSSVGFPHFGGEKFRPPKGMHAHANTSQHEHASAAQVLERVYASGFNDRRLAGAVLAKPDRALACPEYATAAARTPTGIPGLWRRVFTSGEHPARPAGHGTAPRGQAPAAEAAAPEGSGGAGQGAADRVGATELAMALADLGDADPSQRAMLLADERAADLGWLSGELRVMGMLR